MLDTQSNEKRENGLNLTKVQKNRMNVRETLHAKNMLLKIVKMKKN